MVRRSVLVFGAAVLAGVVLAFMSGGHILSASLGGVGGVSSRVMLAHHGTSGGDGHADGQSGIAASIGGDGGGGGASGASSRSNSNSNSNNNNGDSNSNNNSNSNSNIKSEGEGDNCREAAAAAVSAARKDFDATLKKHDETVVKLEKDLREKVQLAAGAAAVASRSGKNSTASSEAQALRETLSRHGGPFSALFTPEADASDETMWKCMGYAAYADICVYRRLCFQGTSKLTFILRNRPKFRGTARVPNNYRSLGMIMSTKLPKEPILHAQPEGRFTPLYYKGSEVKFIKPDELEKASKPPRWINDKPLYVPAYQEQLGNIWYYSSRILPLYNAWRRTEEWGLPPVAESDVVLVGPSEKIKYDWHRQALNLAIPNTTRVFYREDKPYFGLDSKDQLVCVDTAVLTGAQVYGFPNFMSAFEYRAAAYESVGITVPESPPPTIWILDRGSIKPRHISNIQGVKDTIKSLGYDAERILLSEANSFEDQVKLFAGTGVLVTVHGAGLMNQIFMPPGSAVVEIFPVHVKHVLYERVAHYAGVYHFKVYAKEFEKNFYERHPEYKKYECDNFKSLEIPTQAKCWPLVKNSNVVVPLDELREAVFHALDFVLRARDPERAGMEGDPLDR